MEIIIPQSTPEYQRTDIIGGVDGYNAQTEQYKADMGKSIALTAMSYGATVYSEVDSLSNGSELPPAESLEASPDIPRQRVTDFFTYLQSKADAVPEIHEALEYAAVHPEVVYGIFQSYASLIGDVTRFSQKELDFIEKQRSFRTGKAHSATKISAVEIMSQLSEAGKQALAKAATQTINPDSPHFSEAVDDLIARMEFGHQLKEEGKTPADGNEEWDRAIYSHTLVSDPEALIHFLTTHLMERSLRLTLHDLGTHVADGKDTIVNLIGDGVLADHFGKNQYPEIFRHWSRERPVGMQWMNANQRRAHSATTASSMLV